LTRVARKTLAATGLDTLSPALASSQAPALVSNTPRVPSERWRSLPTPRERFRAWIASHPSEDEAAEALCDQIADGGNLKEFCRTSAFSHSSVLRWITSAPDRLDLYVHAPLDSRRPPEPDLKVSAKASTPQSQSTTRVRAREETLLSCAI